MKTRHETATGEDAVEIDTDSTPTYVTYTKGNSDPLYIGDNFNDAAKSLGMGEDTFNELTMSDDVWADNNAAESPILLQRCRSHNTNSTPAEWETIETKYTPEDAITALWSYQQICRATGDQFRLSVNGRSQIVVDSTTIVDE
jgi:hypothetical protein